MQTSVSEFSPSQLHEPGATTLNLDSLRVYAAGFKFIGGNASPQQAKIVGIGDPDHSSDLRYIGNFLRPRLKPDDVVLLESDDVKHAAEMYGLSGLNNVASWEDPRLYALAHLIAAREIMATSKYLEACRQNDDLATRLGGALVKLYDLGDRVVLTQRTDTLAGKAIAESNPESGTIYFIAGLDHLDDRLQAYLVRSGLPFALLTAMHPPQTTAEQRRDYLDHLASEEIAMYKRQWLTGEICQSTEPAHVVATAV